MKTEDLVIGREYVSGLGVTFKLIEIKEAVEMKYVDEEPTCVFTTDGPTTYYCSYGGRYLFSTSTVLKSFKPVKK